MNLEQFLSTPNLRNIWIHEHSIDVYVRKSNRMLTTASYDMVPCLDLASVEVIESARGKGIFTEFLSRFEQEAKRLNRAVYVESILNTRLQSFLIARGYNLMPNVSALCPSMFKIIA